MGLLYCPRFIAYNNTTGAILPGARLYTFDATATTTPKTTYADNALTVQFGAFVEADALGVFPPIFGTSNDLYYMELRTPGGLVVDQFPYVAVLGPDDTSVFLKDLGANGRFQVRGEGGVVKVETGNAEGDDVGGSGRLGGWNGTQGDDLSIDYLTTSVTGSQSIAGNLTVTGGGLQLGSIPRAVPRALVRSSATNVASISMSLDSAYEAWEIHIRNLHILGVGGTLAARFSFDGGLTFKSGSSDYYAGGSEQGNSSYVNTAWATASSVQVGPAASAATGTAGGGDFVLRVTSTASRETRISSSYIHHSTGSAADRTSGWRGGSTNSKSFGKITDIQVLDVLGGNITADYVVIGLP